MGLFDFLAGGGMGTQEDPLEKAERLRREERSGEGSTRREQEQLLDLKPSQRNDPRILEEMERVGEERAKETAKQDFERKESDLHNFRALAVRLLGAKGRGRLGDYPELWKYEDLLISAGIDADSLPGMSDEDFATRLAFVERYPPYPSSHLFRRPEDLKPYNIGKEADQETSRAWLYLDRKKTLNRLRNRGNAGVPAWVVPESVKTVFDSSGRKNDVVPAITHLKDEAKKNGVDNTDPVDPALLFVKMAGWMGETPLIGQIVSMGRAVQSEAELPGKERRPETGEEAELPETARRRRAEEGYMRALQRLRSYPEMRSFGSVGLYFLAALVMGVRQAAGLFERMHDTGKLELELKFYKEQLDAAERREERAMNARLRGRYEAATSEARERHHQDRMILARQKMLMREGEIEAKIERLKAKSDREAATAEEKKEAAKMASALDRAFQFWHQAKHQIEEWTDYLNPLEHGGTQRSPTNVELANSKIQEAQANQRDMEMIFKRMFESGTK